ncbi:hypothetical protein FIBSPDRAFT_892933 [Athelia psychrophila]|uniref:Uncharacterized protein n=1 Tax=Athelia psychrophila TaxID=1759441 RepID=A0A166HQL2_9AGAM|nr:hypothetical protein FIBSPDRAFT_892933 [Fibularhizoctonia sp. CBS 109695]
MWKDGSMEYTEWVWTTSQTVYLLQPSPTVGQINDLPKRDIADGEHIDPEVCSSLRPTCCPHLLQTPGVGYDGLRAIYKCFVAVEQATTLALPHTQCRLCPSRVCGSPHVLAPRASFLHNTALDEQSRKFLVRAGRTVARDQGTRWTYSRAKPPRLPSRHARVKPCPSAQLPSSHEASTRAKAQCTPSFHGLHTRLVSLVGPPRGRKTSTHAQPSCLNQPSALPRSRCARRATMSAQLPRPHQPSARTQPSTRTQYSCNAHQSATRAQLPCPHQPSVHPQASTCTLLALSHPPNLPNAQLPFPLQQPCFSQVHPCTQRECSRGIPRRASDYVYAWPPHYCVTFTCAPNVQSPETT